MALGRNELTRVLPPEAFRKKRPEQPPEETPVGFPERLALFLVAMHRDRSAELMRGLSGPLRKRVETWAQEALSWDSPARQARVVHEFGVRNDATSRLKDLMSKASPRLRVAIFDRLPSWAQTLFPKLVGHAEQDCPPAMLALAERLVRETTR